MSERTQKVITVLEEGGWYQGDFVGQSGYCLVGAAGKAWHGEPEFFAPEFFMYWDDDDPEMNPDAPDDFEWLRRFARFLLDNHSGLRLSLGLGDSETTNEAAEREIQQRPDEIIEHWNDSLCTSRDEVTDMLERFATQEGADS